MDLAELEIFRAVAREQSVTRAARLLDRVQSNVTTRVKQLEDSLGVALFQRDSRKMLLTPEGQRLLGYADRLLALAEEAQQSMRAGAPSGSLRVGSMESSAATLLPAPLASFHAAFPNVALSLATGTTQNLVEAVLSHRLDCAVVAHPGTGPADSLPVAALGDGLEGAFIRTEDLVLVLPATHPPVRRPDDVTLRRLAAFTKGCTYRRCAEDWLDQAGDAVRHKLSVVEMSSYHALLAQVAAGSAVAIVPRAVLALHPDAAGFRTAPVRQAHTFLVWRAGSATAARDAFLQALREAA